MPWTSVAAAAREAGVVTIVGTERPALARPRDRVGRARRGRDAAGRAGEDPDRPVRGAPLRPGTRTPGVHGRRRDVRGRDLSRGFRYPEIVRSLVLGGAQIDLRPAFRDDRRRLAAVPLVRRVEPVQREGAALPGAREHRLRRRIQRGRPRPGLATCIIAPDGTLVASLPYGGVGVVAADVDLDRADRRLALRWAPERNIQVAAPG